MAVLEEEVEQYKLGRTDIEDIISEKFPKHRYDKSELTKLKHNCIYAYITLLPSSATVTSPSNNMIEMVLHQTDEEGFNRRCGDFRLKMEDNGSLMVSKKIFDNEWQETGTIKPS